MKIAAKYDFVAWRKRAEKHYEEKFPNIGTEERNRLIDHAEKVMREKYTPEFKYEDNPFYFIDVINKYLGV